MDSHDRLVRACMWLLIVGISLVLATMIAQALGGAR